MPIRLTLLVPLLLALLLSPLGVQAHAVLQSVSPADGALLDQPPTALVLTFNEPVAPLAIRLTAPDGTARDLLAEAAGNTLRLLLGDLGQGSHVLSWRVASDDGHPVAGAAVFSVGRMTGTTLPPEAAPGLRPGIWALRLVLSLGLVLAVGAAVFVALGGPPRATPARRLIRGASALALLAVPALLGLQGLDGLGAGYGALLTPAPWVTAAGTSLGPALAWAAAAAVLARASLRLAPLAFAALLALGLAYAMSGHAGTAPPQWVSRPLVVLHLAALTLWIGALVPLAAALTTQGAEAALRRFSARIPWAVLGLVLSGAGLVWLQLGPEPAAWDSAYSRILLAKLALFALLLALGGWNRWRLTAPALAGRAPARHAMRRIIGAELLLALAILGLAAGWRFTPPPRALAMAPAPMVMAHLHADDAMANLTLTPTGVEIWLTDADLVPLVASGLSLSLTLPEHGIGPITRAAEPEGDGLWRIPGLVLPQPGQWQADLDIRISRFTLIPLSGGIDIP